MTKKEIKRLKNKFVIFSVAFVALLAGFIFISKVYASGAVNLKVTFRDTNYEHGKVQYSLDDGDSWNDITSNTEMNVTYSGDRLRLKIVPNANYSVDYAGIELTVNGENYSGFGLMFLWEIASKSVVFIISNTIFSS